MALAMQKINSQPSIHVLVVEDDRSLREALADTLQLADYQVTAVNSAEDALKELAMQNDIALIVSDVNMGGMTGHELLKNIKMDYPQIPVILITAYASVSESVDAIKNGAVDYLVKPFAPNILVETIARHLGVAQLVGDEPVVSAAASKQLLQLAQRVAVSDSTVLILGESGTGKEVLARYIHEHSTRRNQPFIAINCAAIPENMLEAMLFGYEKGAYTGAHASTPGKFEQANGGTLLLDEISEMDIGLQAKLLRVLQEREVERLGGRKTIKLDVRVIATSNRDMRSEVIAGKFREDLYYRLSVMPLRWLPLRERPEDIAPLAEKLLQKHAQKQNRRGMSLSSSAQQALLSYSWPGNVRELDNTMQRALILQAGHLIQAEDLGLDIAQTMALSNDFSSPISKPAAFTLPEIATPTFQFTHPTAEPANNSAQQLGDDLRQREYEIIMNTLRLEGGSRKNTAERLGISARTLRYKIARLREDGFAITE
ncbi:MAG: sigma-54-dependent Fis family transcriptional regulator [Cellvibrio sp.]|nr:sigma-54-dependent Fis family transcriptional regulator [Cellvibrio sp.]